MYFAIAKIQMNKTNDRLWGFKLYNITKECTIDRGIQSVTKLVRAGDIVNLILIQDKYIQDKANKLSDYTIFDKQGNLLYNGSAIGISNTLEYNFNFELILGNGYKAYKVSSDEAYRLYNANKLIFYGQIEHIGKDLENKEKIEKYTEMCEMLHNSAIDNIISKDGKIVLQQIHGEIKVYKAPDIIEVIHLECHNKSLEILDLSSCQPNCKIEKIALNNMQNLRKLILPKGLVITDCIDITNCSKLESIVNLETIKVICSRFICGSTSLELLEFDSLEYIHEEAIAQLELTKQRFKIVNKDNTKGCYIDNDAITINEVTSEKFELDLSDLHINSKSKNSILFYGSSNPTINVKLTLHTSFIFNSAIIESLGVKSLHLNFLGDLYEESDRMKMRCLNLTHLRLDTPHKMPDTFYTYIVDSEVSNIGDIEGNYITDTERNLIIPYEKYKLTKLVISDKYKEYRKNLDFVIQSKDNKYELKVSHINDHATEVTIPPEVRCIMQNKGGNKLRRITFTNTIEIEAKVFMGLYLLEGIVGMEYITSYGDLSFAFTGIKQAIFGPNISKLGVGAFLGCVKINEIHLNNAICNNIGNIPRLVFSLCINLTKLTGERIIPIHPTNLIGTQLIKNVTDKAIKQCTEELVSCGITTISFKGTVKQMLEKNDTLWRELMSNSHPEFFDILSESTINLVCNFIGGNEQEIYSKRKKKNDKFLNTTELIEFNRIKAWYKFHEELDKHKKKVEDKKYGSNY